MDAHQEDAEHLLERLSNAYSSPDRHGGGVGRAAVLTDLVSMSEGSPGRAGAVVRLGLERGAIPELEELVDRLPDAGLAPVADAAVEVLFAGADIWDSQATWLVSRIAQQDPTAVAPHREVLLRLVRADPPGAPWWLWPPEWSWRDAPDRDLDLLAEVLDDPDPGMRTVAWSCLVASRTATGLALAHEARGVQVPDDEDAEVRLLMAARDPDDPGRSLVAVATPSFVDLPKRYYRSGSQPQLRAAPGVGPDLPPIAAAGTYGGTLPDPCPTCGAPLQAVLDVADLPGAPDLPPIVTCAACIGQAHDVVFMDHADDLPPIDQPEPEGEPGDVGALPPTPFVLRPVPPRSWLPTIEDWSTQVLDRLGGEPAWRGAPEYPTCPRCQRRMPFVLQVTSPDIRQGPGPSSEDPRWSWGDTGMLWAFWCAPCRVTATWAPFADEEPPADGEMWDGAVV